MKNLCAAAAIAVGLLEAVAAGRETRADLMQQLVVAAFPELTGTDVMYRWRLWPQPVAEVFRGTPRLGSNDSPPNPVLTVEMTSHAHQTWQVAFTGEIVNDLANHRLYNALMAHAEWSRDDLTRWLTADGAAYGPDRKTQLTAALDVPRFEGVFGPLTVAFVDFSWRFDHSRAGEANVKPPVWRVALRPTSRSAVRCHILLLEPYRGRVQTVMTSADVCGPHVD